MHSSPAGPVTVFRSFLLALSFLSRLGPSIHATSKEMSRSVVFYPVVGIVIGVILVIPFAQGLFHQLPWIQAWLYVLFSAWLTRALHLDGLADILDALGSAETGEGFYTVLKDSRMGAFGACGLVLVMSGQIVICSTLFATQSWAVLFFAPVCARCLPIFLATIAPVNAQASLGAFLAAAPQKTAIAVSFITILVLGVACLPITNLVLALALALCFLFFLVRLARREGGYNGDYFGFIIVCGELSVLLAALA